MLPYRTIPSNEEPEILRRFGLNLDINNLTLHLAEVITILECVVSVLGPNKK
jgi:hypothetical protein